MAIRNIRDRFVLQLKSGQKFVYENHEYRCHSIELTNDRTVQLETTCGTLLSVPVNTTVQIRY